MVDINLIGKTYNYLTVIAPHESVMVSGKKMRAWVCRCVCGREVVKADYYLKRGTVKSCGCMRKDGSLYSTHECEFPEHADCFGRDGTLCTILSECPGKKCSFYKTKEEFEKGGKNESDKQD